MDTKRGDNGGHGNNAPSSVRVQFYPLTLCRNDGEHTFAIGSPQINDV